MRFLAALQMLHVHMVLRTLAPVNGGCNVSSVTDVAVTYRTPSFLRGSKGLRRYSLNTIRRLEPDRNLLLCLKNSDVDVGSERSG